MEFKDHFSGHAKDYSRFRPTYPEAAFEYLAGLNESRLCAWDCGTGNGQAARELIRHFTKVYATDGSAQQIEQAPPTPGIAYSVGTAEASGLADASVDLVLAAQAAHWFDHQAFHQEVKRVCRGKAIVALLAYGLFKIRGDIDEIVNTWYREVLDPYWAPERHHIEAGYKTIPFPYQEIDVPTFQNSLKWNLDHLLGYLGTWSAVKAYHRQTGKQALDLIRGRLEAVWGPPEQEHTASWDLILRVGRVFDT